MASEFQTQQDHPEDAEEEAKVHKEVRGSEVQRRRHFKKLAKEWKIDKETLHDLNQEYWSTGIIEDTDMIVEGTILAVPEGWEAPKDGTAGMYPAKKIGNWRKAHEIEAILDRRKINVKSNETGAITPQLQ